MGNSLGGLDPIWAVAGMTAAAFLTRTGGFWLMGHVTITPRVRRMLSALPGAIVMSIIVPLIGQGGLSAVVAIVAAALAMLLSRSEFVAMAAGVGVAAALRAGGI